jgi:hypothetical protein
VRDLPINVGDAVIFHEGILSLGNLSGPCKSIYKPLECLGYPSEQRSQRDATEVDKVVHFPA